jgi:hypothetical protein
MLSIWPFRNKAFVRSLETAQEVVEKQNKLEETIIQHGRPRGRLYDLGLTLEQDRLQRRREFIEEREQFSAALNDSMLAGEMLDEKNKVEKEKVRVARMKLEKEKAQLQKDIDDLKPPPPPPPEPLKKKTTRGRSPKQKKREEVLTRYEKEIARIEADKKLSAKAKADLKKAAEAEKEEAMAEVDNMP